MPSCRKALVVSAIGCVGKSAKQMEMSIAVMTNSTALAKVARVEHPVVGQELHQVQRRQVAGGVVQVHVLAARVRGVDPARLRAGVPVVDGVVVLDARVGALPGGLRDLAEKLTGVDGLDDLAGLPGTQAEARHLHRPRA